MLGLAFWLASSLSGSQSDTQYTLGITNYTDVLTTVPLNRILITQGGVRRTYMTGDYGYTRSFPVLPSVPFSVALKPRSTPEGTTVGQLLESCSIPNAPAGNDISIHLFFLFQPILEPVVLDSSSPRPVQSTHHDRWFMLPNEGATYLLSANVGILMTPREIAALAGYYGVQLEQDDYRAGLVIAAADPEDLGNVGVRLLMDFQSYGFNEAPGVDRYVIANSQQDLSAATFEIDSSGWEGLVDRADYELWGVLGKGLNLLLFREGPSGDLVRVLADTPTFPPPTLPSSLPLQVQSCQPAAPVPSGLDTCQVNPPPSDMGCPLGDCMGPVYCTTTYIPAGQSFCGGGQGSTDTRNVGVSTTISGGVSPTVVILGIEITPSAGVSTTENDNWDIELGPGANNCGQCAQMWKKVVTCSMPCTVEKNAGRTLSGGYLCLDALEDGKCMDCSGTDTTKCDRSGC